MSLIGWMGIIYVYCIHICWYWQTGSDWSLLFFDVLLDSGSKARNRAEQKPSGFITHPKYHERSSDIRLCWYLSVFLIKPWRSRVVLLSSLSEACLCVSYGSWHRKGPLCNDKWLGLESALRLTPPELCLWFSGAWRQTYGTIQPYAGLDLRLSVC